MCFSVFSDRLNNITEGKSKSNKSDQLNAKCLQKDTICLPKCAQE